VAAVLLAPPPEAETMTIAGLLMSQDRWGRARTSRFLRLPIPMRETKTLGSLTERQRGNWRRGSAG
jgi:hypothetical protein